MKSVIVAGAHKAGTTTLSALLNQHPEIAMSVVKETNHYCPDLWPLLDHLKPLTVEDVGVLHAKGKRLHIGVIKDKEAYISAFPVRPEAKYRAEASPFYLRSSLAAKEIANRCPDAKIIIVLRDPIDRLLSHYFMEIRDARIPEPIEFAIREEKTTLALGQLPIHGLLDSGLYGQGLSRFLEHFPDEQVLLLDSADLADTNRLISLIADFLQIDQNGFGVGIKSQNESLAARNQFLNRLMAQSGAKEIIRKLVPKKSRHEIGPYIPGLNFSDFCLHQYGDSNDRTFDILGQPSQRY